MSNLRYRRIVRDYERRFVHQVYLPHCQLALAYGLCRRQLDYLDRSRDVAGWHVGNRQIDSEPLRRALASR